MSKAIEDVKKERTRQDEKWGQQSHGPFTWLAILGEEVGETNQAALEAHKWAKGHFGGEHEFEAEKLAHYREEMVQVAAVAVAAVEALDRQLGN